jgi:outer membrane biosynthesis protein TonB
LKNKKEDNKMATKKELTTVAKELNKVLGLDPAIDTGSRVKLADLEEAIKQAIGLIEPGDEFTEATQAIITALSPALQEEAPEEDDDDVEEETPEEETPEEEAPEEEAPKADKKKEKKDKPAKKAKAKDDNKPTKKKIVLECLKKGATIEQMAKEIVKAGIDDDYDKNCRVVKAWLGKMGFDTKKAAIEANPIFKGGR